MNIYVQYIFLYIYIHVYVLYFHQNEFTCVSKDSLLGFCLTVVAEVNSHISLFLCAPRTNGTPTIPTIEISKPCGPPSTSAKSTKWMRNQSAVRQWMRAANLHASNPVACTGSHSLGSSVDPRCWEHGCK